MGRTRSTRTYKVPGFPALRKRRTTWEEDGGFYDVYLEGKAEVGSIQIQWVGREELLRSECEASFASIEDQVGTTLDVYGVIDARIVSGRYIERGLGVQMYLSALQRVAQNGGALVAARCVRGWYGTSADARRVWRSRRFRKNSLVSGLVATMPEELPREANPKALAKKLARY